tara:strand:- start:2017 stop:2571 length:555 start_codon:yes stop_codon:yes gene_type:complete
MELPIFELKIDGDGTGVTAVALVNQPAIGIEYQTFNKAMKFNIADEEQRVVMGAAMIPNLPIYRMDNERGEYFAVFSKQTIRKIAEKFFKENKQSSYNEEHNPNKLVEGGFTFQSFITDEKMGISAPKGFENIAEGTWFIAAKIENDEVWNKIKTDGEYKGFSIEGMFDVVPYVTMSKIIQKYI